MPRRALISFLIFLTGVGGLAAGPLNLGKKNARFQPGRALPAAVLHPARVKMNAGGQSYPGVTVQKITPIAQMPARVEVGRTTFRAPREAKIPAAIQPAVATH